MQPLCRLGLVFALALVVTRGALAEPVETETAGLSVELLGLRDTGGVSRLDVRFVNTTAAPLQGGELNLGAVVLVDARTKRKHFALKDADGRFLGGPTSDWGEGGRWFLALPAHGESVFWILFEPLPVGTEVSVELPQAFPFDGVQVTSGDGVSGKVAPSTPAGFHATLVSAKRSAGELTVRIKLERDANGPNDVPEAEMLYSDAFVLDAAARRKYPLMKDADGIFLAQPRSDPGNGGRYFLNTLAPGKTALMSLTFMAPPDNVATADIVLPRFAPIEGVALAGQGGATTGGIAAGGRTIGFEGALKELNAVTTPEEIRIDLSADVLFDFDKADLKATAEAQLSNLLAVVNGKPSAVVSIEGHTDVRGDAAYNQKLSERRAQAVRGWLVSHGATGDRLRASGAGESRPLRTGNTEADHAANRRVEIRIRG